MEIFIIWLVLSILCGMYAGKLNRSGFGYFALACFLSPIVGFVALLVLGDNAIVPSKIDDKKTNKRYKTEIHSDYEKVLEKVLKFYDEYNLKPSEYNTDDDYDKKFKNEYGEYFEINKVNDIVILETCNLPKFNDIQPEIKENKSNIDDLVKLGELLEKGLLTKEEFEAQKAKLLNA